MSHVLRRLPAATLLAVALVAALLVPAHAGTAPAVAAHHPTTLLVGFEPDATALERAAVHSAHGAVLDQRFAALDLDVVRLAAGVDPLAAAATYERAAGVAYAHPNWQVRLLNVPNDLLFAQQWGFDNRDDHDIDGPEGWAMAFGTGTLFPSTGGVRVGVLDTGIDLAHVDLLGKTQACASAVLAIGVVIDGVCSDDNLHGTHVSGTVAAITGNGVGVAGTAPDAELAVFKALNAAGIGFYADVIAGIQWLADPAKGAARIISMSIGGPEDSALEDALTEAAKTVLLVAAAGNDGDGTANYPAYHPDVISVAATDRNDRPASFSNCNSDVELAAPGVGIWSTAPANTYLSLSGTSMATPHVSGVAAMIMARDDLTAAETRTRLASTADDLGATGRDACSGYGRINLAAALAVDGDSTTPVADQPTAEGPGAIAGTVTTGNGRWRTALAGATVDCQTAGSATTASDGTYTISDVTPGTYTCTASADGYPAKSQSVTVSSGQTTTADFHLRAAR